MPAEGRYAALTTCPDPLSSAVPRAPWDAAHALEHRGQSHWGHSHMHLHPGLPSSARCHESLPDLLGLRSRAGAARNVTPNPPAGMGSVNWAGFKENKLGRLHPTTLGLKRGPGLALLWVEESNTVTRLLTLAERNAAHVPETAACPIAGTGAPTRTKDATATRD